jgi:hypothetical protein
VKEDSPSTTPLYAAPGQIFHEDREIFFGRVAHRPQASRKGGEEAPRNMLNTRTDRGMSFWRVLQVTSGSRTISGAGIQTQRRNERREHKPRNTRNTRTGRGMFLWRVLGVTFWQSNHFGRRNSNAETQRTQRKRTTKYENHTNKRGIRVSLVERGICCARMAGKEGG